jgi:hypothetical protein
MLQGLLLDLLWCHRVAMLLRLPLLHRPLPRLLEPPMMRLLRLQGRLLVMLWWLVVARRRRLVLQLVRLLSRLEDRRQHREQQRVQWWLVVVDRLLMLVLQLPQL